MTSSTSTNQIFCPLPPVHHYRESQRNKLLWDSRATRARLLYFTVVGALAYSLFERLWISLRRALPPPSRAPPAEDASASPPRLVARVVQESAAMSTCKHCSRQRHLSGRARAGSRPQSSASQCRTETSTEAAVVLAGFSPSFQEGAVFGPVSGAVSGSGGTRPAAGRAGPGKCHGLRAPSVGPPCPRPTAPHPTGPSATQARRGGRAPPPADGRGGPDTGARRPGSTPPGARPAPVRAGPLPA